MAADVAKSTSPAGLWSNLRSVIPRWRSQPVSGKDARPAVQVAACAAAAAQDVPVDGTPHASPAQRERQDEQAQGAAPGLDFGYQRGLERRFRAVREVGKGGNGVVRVVQELSTGTEWALKSVPKVLTDPSLSDAKRAGHVEAVKREVEVLGRLRGCLNVAALEDVYEDDTHVHMVLELCRGGVLHHFIGETHYSERTVASYMRAVLRTLAQCHSQHILHRDVKPGNFLLASEDPAARLKAIDFGLAVFFSDEALPRTDLGLEGTPWFMAPETLRSEVYPASDVWAAGVTAHQLLTGRFPFDDRSNPFAPSLSKVWRSILVDDLDMKRGHWDGISSEAKDFVATLLNKDHSKRPSAREALQHPWLQGPGTSERGKGKKLSMGVVQRIQRYSQGSAFKRGVLDMIAEELLREGPDTAERAVPIGRGAVPIITDPQASPLEYLYEHLSFTDRSLVDREEVADGLAQLGYRLSAEEIERLLDQLDPGNTGKVGKSQVAASQMDWSVLQQNQTERWLKCVRRAFQDLDTDNDGIISSGDMVAMLRNKLPKAEVEAAVRHALHEAARRSEGSRHRGATGAAAALASCGEGSVHSTGSGGDSVRDGMSFRQFLRMLRAGSADSLDVYDDRYGSNGSYGSLGSLSGLAASSSLADKSMRGSCHAGSLLDPIREAA